MTISSGDSYSQVSSESLNIIADGHFSMTDARDNIMLSAHTSKLKTTHYAWLTSSAFAQFQAAAHRLYLVPAYAFPHFFHIEALRLPS